MTELFPVDQIVADPGLPGTLEYALGQAGIPALTVELGGPRGFDAEMMRIGVEGGFLYNGGLIGARASFAL